MPVGVYPHRSESQRRPGNQNAKGKALVKRAAKWEKPKRRYTTLTEELLEKVSGLMLDGFTDEEIGVLCHCDDKTIVAWRNLGVVQTAVLTKKRHYIHEVRDGKRRDWTRLAWWLERRYPLEFSRPEVAHLIRQSHVQNNTVNNFVISSELADQLALRAGKVDETIKRLFEGKDRVGAGRENRNSHNSNDLTDQEHYHTRDVDSQIVPETRETSDASARPAAKSQADMSERDFAVISPAADYLSRENLEGDHPSLPPPPPPRAAPSKGVSLTLPPPKKRLGQNAVRPISKGGKKSGEKAKNVKTLDI